MKQQEFTDQSCSCGCFGIFGSPHYYFISKWEIIKSIEPQTLIMCHLHVMILMSGSNPRSSSPIIRLCFHIIIQLDITLKFAILFLAGIVILHTVARSTSISVDQRWYAYLAVVMSVSGLTTTCISTIFVTDPLSVLFLRSQNTHWLSCIF